MRSIETLTAFAVAHPLLTLCFACIAAHYLVRAITATLRGLAEIVHGVPENVPLIQIPDRITVTADVTESDAPWRNNSDEEEADEDAEDDEEEGQPSPRRRFHRIRPWLERAAALAGRMFRSRVDIRVTAETKVRPRFSPNDLLRQGVIEPDATFDVLPLPGCLYCVREVEMARSGPRVRLVGISGSQREDGSEHSFDLRGFFIAGKKASN